MNDLEYEMLSTLKHLRDDFGVVGVKAEFEAEGTRIDELLRLIDIVRKAKLKLGIKIGGCEAMKDLMECRQIGVDYIIAPMVETNYALKKFIEAKNKVFNEDEKKFTSFLINVETDQTFQNIEKISKVVQENKKEIQGYVFGRVDYSLSKELDRDEINSDIVLNDVMKVSSICKDLNLELVVGGGVSIDALGFLKTVKNNFLSRFETRKIMFSADALEKSLDKGMLEAVKFELLWLKNKKNYYGSIFNEDNKRIEMLQKRWDVN